MSCIVCDETPVSTYVRVQNGNVEITGCKEHLTELLRLLRLAREG
jgi:hypothetical protein